MNDWNEGDIKEATVLYDPNDIYNYEVIFEDAPLAAADEPAEPLTIKRALKYAITFGLFVGGFLLGWLLSSFFWIPLISLFLSLVLTVMFTIRFYDHIEVAKHGVMKPDGQVDHSKPVLIKTKSSNLEYEMKVDAGF